MGVFAKLRNGLGLAFVGLLLCILAGPASACPMPKDAIVTQSERVQVGTRRLTVAALSLPDPNADRSRLLVLDRRCRVLWAEDVDGLESRFEVRLIGRSPMLHFVSLRPAGDGTGYTHRLLVLRGRRLALATGPIVHTGKDGFYLGPLRAPRGEGVVTWTADPSGEAEAEPHPYVITTWRWRHGRFTGPVRSKTAQSYAPADDAAHRADAVAEAMGLPYRDQTGAERFMDPSVVMQRRNILEERLAARR